MSDCTKCKYALFDYCEYYGTAEKNWFVDDCKKGGDITSDECEEYEERRDG